MVRNLTQIQITKEKLQELKKVQNQLLENYQGNYKDAIKQNLSMNDRITIAIRINQLRTELGLKKKQFKEEIRYLKSHYRILNKKSFTSHTKKV